MPGYKRYTLEQKNNVFVVYGWDQYPRYSVLAGQSRKTYLHTFDTEEEALTQFPDAKLSNRWVEPQVSLNHLSDRAGSY